MRIIICVFFSTILLGCFSKTKEKNTLEGTALPAFNLLLTDSSTWLNPAQASSGRATVLFLFTPNCPYCRGQIMEVTEKIDKFKDVNFYAITAAPHKDMKKFATQFDLEQYKSIKVGRDTAEFVLNYFNPDGVPFIAVYNAKNKLTKTFSGKSSVESILSAAKEEVEKVN